MKSIKETLFIKIIFFALIVYLTVPLFSQNVFNRNDNYDFRGKHYLSAGGTNPDNFNLFIESQSDFRLFKLYIKKSRLDLGISWLANQYRIDMNNDGIWDLDWTTSGEKTVNYIYPNPPNGINADHQIKIEIQYSNLSGGTTNKIKYVPITVFSTPRIYVDADNNSFIQLRDEDASAKIPIIMVEGFDPTNEKYPELYYNLTWELINTDLFPNGYEVFIINFNDGGRDLRLNATVLLKAIEKVHEICPNFKIGLAGLSMGGPISRYALAKKEDQGGTHDVGLFISYDSPQMWAHVSPDLQDWIKIQNPNDGAISVLQTSLQSVGAKQMLGYNSYDPFHILRDEFYNELKLLNGDGYPHLSFNAAVSNGNLNATWGYTSVGRHLMTLKINDNLIKDVPAVYLDCGVGSKFSNLTMKRYGDIFTSPFVNLWYDLQITFNPSYIPTYSALDLVNPVINNITGDISSHEGSKFDAFVVQQYPLQHHELSEVTRNNIMDWLDLDFDIEINYSLLEGGTVNPENYQVNILHGIPITVQPQTVNLNGKPVTFNFWKWEDGNIDNPRTFYTSHNISHTAFLKGIQISDNINAFSNNSSRKFIRTDDGTLHLVYSSMQKIWYEISTNGGSTWLLMNNGFPLNDNEAKNPSIDYYSSNVAIVYQENNNGNYKIQLHLFGANGNTYIQTAAATVADEVTEEYTTDANPVIAYGYNGKAIICWETKTILNEGLKFMGASIGYGAISFYNATGFGDEYSTTPTIVTDKTSQAINYFNLAWSQGNPNNDNSDIYYYDLYFDNNNNILKRTTSPEIPSANCGYEKNYKPSTTYLVQSNGQNAKLEWIGERNSEEEFEKSAAMAVEKNAIFKSRDGLNWYYYTWAFGTEVQSVNINRSGNTGYVIAWSQKPGSNFENKFVKNTSFSSIKTFNTTGKDIQINEGTSFNDMYCNSFSSLGLPYSFNLSQSVGSIQKENSRLHVSSGREGVINRDSSAIYFTLGDIEVNDEKIEFTEIIDNAPITNFEQLNQNLLSEEFTLADNAHFSYSVQYGVLQKGESPSLSGNEFVKFTVLLIDALTNEVIGLYDEVEYNANNLGLYENILYEVDVAGIGDRLVKIKLVVTGNISAEFNVTTRIADESIIAKGNSRNIHFQGSLAVTEYALEQNYPNPFNPVTTIRYQIPKSGRVTLKVYDILGKEITTLVNEEKETGRYTVNFDASALSSGVYLYEIVVNDYRAVKKLMVIK